MPQPPRPGALRHLRAAHGLPALALSLTLLACGGDPPPPERDGPPIGTSGDEQVGPPPAVDGSIELSLRRADGTFLEVGELRGNVVVLFVLATFDGPSQMTVRTLRHLVESDPEVEVVGIAAQQGARLLVDAYEHALAPPFPITYDPLEAVALGQSSLGEIEAIPTLIVLDTDGVEVARHTGFCDDDCMAELLSRAR